MKGNAAVLNEEEVVDCGKLVAMSPEFPTYMRSAAHIEVHDMLAPTSQMF
jgi:hypothetical protein